MQELVRRAGWAITFDWTGAEGEIRTDGSWDSASEKGADIAEREIQACRDADLTILLFPPQGGGLGCWIEMGATLASGGDVGLSSRGATAFSGSTRMSRGSGASRRWRRRWAGSYRMQS